MGFLLFVLWHRKVFLLYGQWDTMSSCVRQVKAVPSKRLAVEVCKAHFSYVTKKMCLLYMCLNFDYFYIKKVLVFWFA